ncbi:MAG TPA: adenylyltransferase/cytidyltransferase family protein [Dehalococcoidia bacterium]|uniref:Putative cytidylyltransferase n=1 Tax=viral metagenome TaxID=1070528 RepID=A0A6M3KT43_9ZZZZ|nr:adenylyltransferase/cytidyltransferase family protein [Dehalococcoidia bacterium]
MELKVGYAFMVADLLHYGHLHFLRECRKDCDFLIVGVYVDELVASYKRRPIIPFGERIELVKELRVVDLVVPVRDRDCTPALKKLVEEGWKVEFLFHGDDWSPDDPDLKKSREYIESVGGRLIQPRYYEERTTTGIIKEIVRRHMEGEKLWN